MSGEDVARSVPNIVSSPVKNTVYQVDAPAAVGLSVERLLYAVALVIGLWLRLWSLGAQPLSPWEASNSWPAWLVANGLALQDVPAPNSALFYGLQWLLFWSGVNSDGGARFLSAIAGALLIVLPWWWRAYLGRRVALIAAFLIAIDGWMVGFSRLADGSALAITLAMLVMVAGSQLLAWPQSVAWKRTVAVGFGLLLVAGPMGWNFVPVVLWWGWLRRGELARAGLLQRQWLAWVGGAALLGATMLLARLDGVAWIASGMSVWLTQWDGQSAGPLMPALAGGYRFGWPWLRLWVDAPLLLPFAIGGLIVLFWRNTQDQHSESSGMLFYHLAGWSLWGVLLWLLPGRSPLALVVLGLPLLMLAAVALDALISHVPRELDWREAGAVMLTLAILFVSGSVWLTALLATRNYDPVLAQAALIIFGLLLAILVAFAIWANRRDTLWLSATLVALLFVSFVVRSSWRLNFGDVLSEPAGWQATLAHPEVRMLASDIETLSAHRSGDPYQLAVQVQVAPQVTASAQIIPARPDPVVGWELRNMRNLTWVSSPQVAADANPLPLVVTPASGEEAQLDLPRGYLGSRYHVDAWWLPSTVADSVAEIAATPAVLPEGEEASALREAVRRLQPWWRWLIYREPTRQPFARDVILWAPPMTGSQ